MTHNETEILIKKYLNGETNAEEERLLALEVSGENVPEDWKIIAEMLGELTIDEALFNQEMAQRKHKARIIKLWPWMAVACAVALLVVFLRPPRVSAPVQPQTEQVAKSDASKSMECEVRSENTPSQAEPIAKQRQHVSTTIAKASPAIEREQTAPLGDDIRELTKVDESDIILYADARQEFAEQARTLRERGSRVIHRVSMITTPPSAQSEHVLPSNNNQFNDL